MDLESAKFNAIEAKTWKGIIIWAGRVKEGEDILCAINGRKNVDY